MSLSKLGFDPRVAKNSNEHLLGPSMRVRALCMHEYTVCMRTQLAHKTYVRRFPTYASIPISMCTHAWPCKCSFMPKTCLKVFLFLIFSRFDPYTLVSVIFKDCLYI